MGPKQGTVLLEEGKAMDDGEEVNVIQIMEQIRERARQHRRCSAAAWQVPAATDAQVFADLTALQRDYDIYHLHFTSHRRFLGALVVLVKRLLLKLLTPVLARQSSYNATNARLMAYLMEQLVASKQPQGQPQEEGGKAQDDGLQALQERLTQVQADVLASQEQALQLMRQQLSKTERQLRQLLDILLTDPQAEPQLNAERRALFQQVLETASDSRGNPCGKP